MTPKPPAPVDITAVTFVAIGPNAWGKGETPDAARRSCRKHIPTYLPKKDRKIVLYRVTGFVGVSPIDGGISYAKGGSCEVVPAK